MRDLIILIVIWLGTTAGIFSVIWVFNKLHSMDWEFKHLLNSLMLLLIVMNWEKCSTISEKQSGNF